MPVDADVIVVGAGPAGASAAYFLGRKGLKVLVLERASLPRYKVCAGGVPYSILQLFPFSFDPVIEQNINKATFNFKNKQITKSVPHNFLVMVMRDKFDLYILQQAQAEVLEKTKVQSISQYSHRVLLKSTSGKTYKARYVLAADGAVSRLAQQMGFQREKPPGVALEVEAKVNQKLLDFFQKRFFVRFGVVEKGYYWIFPKSNHLSIGVGNFYNQGRYLASVLAREMASYGIQIDQYPLYAYPLPSYKYRKNLQSNRALLIGDAAGLVDPLTGEGIRHAVESGKIAAEMIANDDVSNYSLEIEKRIGNDLLWANRFAEFFYARQNCSFEWLIRNKFVFQDMVKILSNQLSYRRSFTKLPFYLANFWKKIPLDDQK